MALIQCPECGKEISDTLERCIHCGYILHQTRRSEQKKTKKKKQIMLVSIIAALLIIAVATGIILIKSKDKAVYQNSKEAYFKINSAANICEMAMADIYDAWRWGIYEWDDSKSSQELADELQKELYIDLSAGAVFLLGEDSSPGYLLAINHLFTENDDWQCCVDLVVASYEGSGTFEEANKMLSEAQSALKLISEKNADYQHYPMLKQYYAKVNAMLNFVKSPAGSFEQLKTTKNDYMNSILTYQGDLSFVFEE